MDALSVLEKKIADLVELVNKMRMENTRLLEENDGLKKKIESLETLSMAHNSEDVHERETTKIMVDGLIRDIDAVIGREHVQ